MSTSDYPVTEFAFLNLVPPTSLETPKLVSGFLTAASAQSSWSGHPLYFFYADKRSEEGNTTTTVYLISGWASVQAHYEWIASPENQELLRFFGDAGLMNVGGLAHLDIDFTKLSFEKCGAIVCRRLARKDGVDNHEADVGKGLRGSLGPDAGLMAEVLWSYRGRAVDEGATDEYELVGYSEGQLEEFGEGYTVIRKCQWDLQG
jgi:hypothetical protein